MCDRYHWSSLNLHGNVKRKREEENDFLFLTSQILTIVVIAFIIKDRVLECQRLNVNEAIGFIKLINEFGLAKLKKKLREIWYKLKHFGYIGLGFIFTMAIYVMLCSISKMISLPMKVLIVTKGVHPADH
ncbi:hypothetical protein K501DRAFT_310698 [Backusella circina FSU 941]|nr:hypothetical protein K501DRAFT_310698 [Backusella circina FSU 941]